MPVAPPVVGSAPAAPSVADDPVSPPAEVSAGRADADEAESARGEGEGATGGAPASGEAVSGDPCPYLVAAGGGWRSLEATRDHRCGALDPPAVVALDKQRRLCLTGGHASCPTYIAAREARGAVLAGVPDGWAPERRFVRTTPVVIQAGPRRSSRPGAPGRLRLVEVAVAALALVVVVLVGARILGGGTPVASPATSPGGSSIAGAGSPGPGVSTRPSVAPGSDEPDGTPGAGGSAAPTAEVSTGPQASAADASPDASPAKKTYRVKKGDTLSAIAAKYGVTVSAIVKANKIKNASSIRVGQVLVIPTPAP